MRFLVALGTLLLSVPSLAQWQYREVPTFATTRTIQVMDNSTIFLAGDAGLFKTTNTGSTWTLIEYNFPDRNLGNSFTYSLAGSAGAHFIDNSTGFIYGNNLYGNIVIFRTTDGAATFKLVYNKAESNSKITAIQFVSSSIGYAITNKGKVVKSIDSGATWTELTIANTSQLNGLHFRDASHGVAVGKNVILTTSDGGASWNTNVTNKDLSSVTHADDQTVWASGNVGALIKSTDGGITWTDMPNSTFVSGTAFGNILFISSTTGFVATSKGMYKTIDGGNFWAPQRSLGSGSSAGVFDMLPNGTGLLLYANYTMAPSIRLAYTTTAGTPMPEHEASAINIVSYPNNLCRGTYPITLQIVNQNHIALTSAVIKWTVNGVSQPSYNWTGNLAPGDTSAVFDIGSYNFLKTARDYVIDAQTYMPNGAADPYPDDDAVQGTYRFNKLTGEYLVGGSGSDFTTLNEPISLLKTYGMCSAVTINLSSGSYPERISLNDITSTSAVNTVTFKSATGNPSDVILNGDGLGSAFVEVLNTPFVTLRGITVNAKSNAIAITGNADGVVIENNILTASLTGNDHSVVIAYNMSGNVLLRNNRISGGDIGLSHRWATSPGTAEFTVDKNTFENHKSEALYLSARVNVKFSNNIIRNNGVGTRFGLFVTEFTGEALVVNNFIEVITTGNDQYQQPAHSSGVWISRSTNKISLFNNTIYRKSPSAQSAISIGESKNITIKNNTITSYDNANVLEISGTNIVSDYNNLFSLSGRIGLFSSSFQGAMLAGTDLTQWQLVTAGFDAHSISVDPQHVEGNIHVVTNTSNNKLNGAGTPIASVTTDIDGEARNATTPDIGADEFNGPSIDIGISSGSATATTCGNNQMVPVTVTNYGTTTINSFTVNSSINGSNIAQSFSQPLLAGAFMSINVGPVAGSGSLSISLSATGDLIAANNTTSVSVSGGGMSGIYTVGGTAPNFTTIAAAISALQTNGVCSNVTINIRPGNYNENIVIGVIPGTAEDRRVTFQSSTKDSTDVTISGNLANIQIVRSSYVTVRHLSVGVPDEYNLYKFDLIASNHIVIEGNRIRSMLPLNVGYNFANPIPCEYNIIRGNNFGAQNNSIATALKVGGGIDGSHLVGVYSRGNVIEGNVFTADPSRTWQNSSVIVEWQDAFRMENNSVTLMKDLQSSFSIDVNNVINGYHITGNKFDGGFSIANSKSENFEVGLIANNFITRGFNAYSSDNFRFVNNTIVAEYYESAGYPQTWTIAATINATVLDNVATQLDRIEVKNNIIVAKGDVACIAYHPDIVESDYNVFYSTYSKKFVKNWGTAIGEDGYSTFYSSFFDWQSATGLDVNSLFINPDFVSETDLHINNDVRLSRKGTNVGVATDIDGDGRLVSSPDIGADEFTLFGNDAGVVSLTNQLICGPTTDIKVKIKNFSKNALTQASIHWSVDGAEQAQKSWTGNLASKQTSADISLGTYNFQSNTSYTLKFWTDSPNGIADENNVNDAITRGSFKSLQDGDFTIQSSSGLSYCPGSPPTLTIQSQVDLDFTYTWKKETTVVGSNQNSLSAATDGTYSVRLAAGGCEFNPAAITITESTPPAAPTISPNGPLEFCVGGNVKLGVPAGFNAYSWSNGQTTSEITVTGNGTFSVKVTDGSGCESAVSTEVQVKVNPLPAKPVIEAQGPVQFCNGGSVVLKAPDGFTSYEWSNGATTVDVTAGSSSTFTVKVKDSNGCVSPVSEQIAVTELDQLPAPEITVLNGELTFCEGGSVSLTVTGDFESYRWSTGETTRTIVVSTASVLNVTVSNEAACESLPSTDVTVTVNEYPVATITSNGAQLLASAGGDSYAWFVDENETPIGDQQIYDVSESGSYSVAVTKDGCTTTSDKFPMIINGLDELPGVTAYPNHASSYFVLSGHSIGNAALNLVDATGKVLPAKVKERRESEIILDVEDLPAGVYVVRATLNEMVMSYKVIVVR